MAAIFGVTAGVAMFGPMRRHERCAEDYETERHQTGPDRKRAGADRFVEDEGFRR
jgi:hypothetical protein